MEFVGLNEIRERFLEFFESKEHLRLMSFPLVPVNDNSLLLIGSGMAPFKPYFTGRETPPSKRVTTCQKCIRTIDIENVGITSRHGTFFEMLGNFSFGDYFKDEIIPWAWEFMTEVMKIPANRLYPSVYVDDDEAFDIWHNKIGLPKERITRLGRDDNFWEVGIGPCGPCSEIYFDRGEEFGCGSPNCGAGCECDRFVEIWNLVFTQFDKQEDGSYKKLEHPNIDTGMGLERIASIMQGVSSIFDVDTIKAIRDDVCNISGETYNTDAKKDISIRIITDHIRAVTFMTSDGVLPSNEGRGYVLRRLLRRAARHGKLLGINKVFLVQLAERVIEVSKDAYPELLEKRDYILKVISVEENRFYQTLDSGMALLKLEMDKLKKSRRLIMLGNDAFKLYDTYGFPLDLMKEILSEEGLSIEEDQFQKEMEKQKERAREAREESTYMGSEETIYNRLPQDMHSEFLGYEEYSLEKAKVLAIIKENEIAESASAGDKVSIILDKTVLYAESGGQKGDKGTIKTQMCEIEVSDCIKVSGNKIAHIGKVKSGSIKTGENAVVSVDRLNRLNTARNHTSTHLLQKALRNILGTHVEQAGSMVSPDRLRFDFTHFAPLTDDEINQVEHIVNEKIFEALNVQISETSIQEAKAKGAMALFGEKYGDTVRVVEIDNFSTELCGGTHLTNTSQAGLFKILSENGISAGVRRIEAITGPAALSYYQEQDKKIHALSQMLKTAPTNIMSKLRNVLSDINILTKEVEKIRNSASKNIVDDLLGDMKEISGIKVITAKVGQMDMNSLRVMGDKIRDKMQGVIILGSEKDGKVNLFISAFDGAVERGVHAGNMIKEASKLCGGGGGGKPNMAQAGGKDPSKIDDALALAVEILEKQVK